MVLVDKLVVTTLIIIFALIWVFFGLEMLAVSGIVSVIFNVIFLTWVISQMKGEE